MYLDKINIKIIIVRTKLHLYVNVAIDYIYQKTSTTFKINIKGTCVQSWTVQSSLDDTNVNVSEKVNKALWAYYLA